MAIWTQVWTQTHRDGLGEAQTGRAAKPRHCCILQMVRECAGRGREAPNAFQDRCLQPLDHPSGQDRQILNLGSGCKFGRHTAFGRPRIRCCQRICREIRAGAHVAGRGSSFRFNTIETFRMMGACRKQRNCSETPLRCCCEAADKKPDRADALRAILTKTLGRLVKSGQAKWTSNIFPTGTI
jgi:hypothetical protein